MAKVKQFNNGPSLCKFIASGNNAEAVLAQFAMNNRVFLQNAVHYAERNLEAKALPVLREALQKLGGSVKAPREQAQAKDWKAKVSIKFGKDVHPDIRNLVLGYVNTHGGMISSNTADDTFVYGCTPEHAKYIMEKMAGTTGVTIGLAK